jgi:hypothetical protein
LIKPQNHLSSKITNSQIQIPPDKNASISKNFEHLGGKVINIYILNNISKKIVKFVYYDDGPIQEVIIKLRNIF